MSHHEKIDVVTERLGSDTVQGLSGAEAKARLEKNGFNELAAKKRASLFSRYIAQFKDVMILILLAAVVISFVVVIVEKNYGELFEPLIILFIVNLNAAIGVFQESKAEKALESLKSMSAPHARVIRDGKEIVIDAREIVVGDIIRLESGDFVPADARLITSASLKIEEAALTGESVPSEKESDAEIKENAPLGDRKNMVFSGCSVTYGTGLAIVTAIGMDTEMGKIAGLLNAEEEGQTPLQRRLAKLGKQLGIVALACCAIIFIIGLIEKQELLHVFMVSVSLAVAAIPEGLPAIVTVVLSIGIQRMVKKNAIIRRLPAVETLGSASIICSDKTGTLTQNRMTLKKVYYDGKEVEDVSNKNSDDAVKLLSFATLCCDGSVEFGDKETHIGDPTETAIIVGAYKNGKVKTELNEKYPRLAELPFDSDRKRMSTIHNIDGKLTLIVKGAFDIMAKRCIKGDIKKAEKVNDEMSNDALRVIAVAYKELTEIPKKLDADALEKDMVFLGLVGMIDPPRPEAKEAVKLCRMAHIKPVMITGDHIGTARAIARELDIFREGDMAITGAQLDEWSDEELEKNIRNISVYARVSPENKIRIVKAWQRLEQIVAMTGDGVNDAPALKAADIGCAMGITGTDVAKGAADMTLTDDNFATIVSAVKEGRGISANIKKVVGFLLCTNISEILTVMIAMIVWQVSPLLSMQLLWINLVTDTLPAIMLGMEPVEERVMTQKPTPKKEGLFANGNGIKIIAQGALFTMLTLVAYYLGRKLDAESGGQTMAFLVLALSQVFHSFNMRSDRSLFKVGPFSNSKLNYAALVSFALMALVMFIPPVSMAFGLISMPWHYYLIGLGLAFAPIPVVEIAKFIGIIIKKNKEKKAVQA